MTWAETVKVIEGKNLIGKTVPGDVDLLLRYIRTLEGVLDHCQKDKMFPNWREHFAIDE